MKHTARIFLTIIFLHPWISVAGCGVGFGKLIGSVQNVCGVGINFASLIEPHAALRDTYQATLYNRVNGSLEIFFGADGDIEMFQDGGSFGVVSWGAQVKFPLDAPNEDCKFYLMYKYYDDNPNEACKYYLCDGKFQDRENHRNENCRKNKID